MLNKTIIIDRAVLGINNISILTDEADWLTLLNKNMSKIGHKFDNYKYCSFRYNIPDNTAGIVVNGFADFADFITDFNNNYSDGTKYTSNIEITVYMDIDNKMKAPTLYAKNSKLGQFKSKGYDGYRKGRYVGANNPGGWNDSAIPENLRQLWLTAFGEDLTTTFIQNNTDIKACFWTKKDCDKLGNIKGGEIIDRYFGSNTRRLYNSTDSDPATDTLVRNSIIDVRDDGQYLVAGAVHAPKYFVLECTSGYNSLHAGDLGSRMPGVTHTITQNPYSVIAVYPIQNTVGGKVLRAIYITPVGVDTVYWDYIDPAVYNVFSVKKSVNGTMQLKYIPFTKDGDGQRLGRINISELIDFERDNTSESNFKGTGDIHLVYQNKLSGKFTELSQSKLRQIRDLRFRIPFFKLVA